MLTLSCSGSFTGHRAFVVHSHCGMCWYFVHFLLLSKYFIYVCTTFCLPILLLMMVLGCFQFLVIVKKAARMFWNKYFCDHVHLFLLGTVLVAGPQFKGL